VARDVSDDGLVIVGYGTSASGREAFRWSGGTMTGLGDLAGGSFQSEANAVSPDGTRVTGYGTAANQRIFTWNSGDGLQDYYGAALAYAISADGGQIAGHVNATYRGSRRSSRMNYHRATRWNGGVPTVIGPESSGSTVDSTFHGLTPDASLAVGTFKNASARTTPFRTTPSTASATSRRSSPTPDRHDRLGAHGRDRDFGRRLGGGRLRHQPRRPDRRRG
jgi:probable HAF family extracellular repeat protein